MQISELARQAAVSVHALRHYERLGLIRPHRRANGYRDYPASMRRAKWCSLPCRASWALHCPRLHSALPTTGRARWASTTGQETLCATLLATARNIEPGPRH